MRRPLLLLAALALLTVAAAGCGSEEPQAAAPELVTVTESRTVTASAPPAVPDGPGTPAVTATITRAPDPAPAPVPARDGIRVPNVVGKDHQLAQDTMQAAGLYNLAEEDATGQGRLLLWDRNWVVVSQSPPAGSVVPEDTTIILRSKKDDE